MLNFKDFIKESQSKDIIITLPAHIEWSDYERELDRVKDGNEVINFKVPFLPKSQPRRVYLCWRGNIVGYQNCCGMVSKADFTCTTTGRQWEGNFIQRTGPFYHIEPIEQKGFQGFRYFDSSVQV